MTIDKIKPVRLVDIWVHPFQSPRHVIQHVFTPDGKVIPGMAVAVNPEKVLRSMSEPETRDIINNARIAFADGIGVVKAIERKTGQDLQRIAGADLWLSILMHSKTNNSRVVLIGAETSVVTRCADNLIAAGVNVVGFQNGFFEQDSVATSLVNKLEPEIVIVAQGSPRQEKLIKKMMAVWPDAFYMGVGGSFDVYTGAVKRAPDAWVRLNLEWLYRLLSEPKRLPRQLKLIKYLYLYFFNKI